MQVGSGGGTQLSSYLNALGVVPSLNELIEKGIEQWMQTAPPRPLSWAVLVCGRQCQAILVGHRITQAQARALRAAEWTCHSRGLWPLPGPALIPPGDRRTLPGSHLPLSPSPQISLPARVSTLHPTPSPVSPSQCSLASHCIWGRD